MCKNNARFWSASVTPDAITYSSNCFTHLVHRCAIVVRSSCTLKFLMPGGVGGALPLWESVGMRRGFAPHFRQLDDLFAPLNLTMSTILFRSCWVPFRNPPFSACRRSFCPQIDQIYNFIQILLGPILNFEPRTPTDPPPPPPPPRVLMPANPKTHRPAPRIFSGPTKTTHKQPHKAHNEAACSHINRRQMTYGHVRIESKKQYELNHWRQTRQDPIWLLVYLATTSGDLHQLADLHETSILDDAESRYYSHFYPLGNNEGGGWN